MCYIQISNHSDLLVYWIQTKEKCFNNALILKSFYCFTKVNCCIEIREHMHVNSLIRLINWELVKTKINNVFQSKLNYLLMEVGPSQDSAFHRKTMIALSLLNYL